MKKILREMTCVKSYNRVFLHGRRYEKNERDGKPGSVADDHLSRTAVAGGLKQPTCAKDGPPCLARLGLASDGACTAAGVTTGTVSSCLAFSPLLNSEQGDQLENASRFLVTGIRPMRSNPDGLLCASTHSHPFRPRPAHC